MVPGVLSLTDGAKYGLDNRTVDGAEIGHGPVVPSMSGCGATCRRGWWRAESSTTPLLGRFMLQATWANVREHAAGPPDYWGARGRRFKSGRPDSVRVSAGQRLSETLSLLLWLDVVSCAALLKPLTRVV